MPRYCVTYHLDQPIPVCNKLQSYILLGISLQYKGELLISIKHAVHSDVLLSNDDLRRLSRSDSQIRLLWNILEFDYGLPIRALQTYVEAIDTSDVAAGQLTGKLGAAICKPAVLPEEALLVDAPLRLHVWLEFVNEARNTPSDAEAVRLYYNVLEDVCGKPNSNSDPAALRIMYTRHFVSHGALKDEKLKAFLKTEFAQETNQFDPNDLKHTNFLRAERQNARKYLERILKKQLRTP